MRIDDSLDLRLQETAERRAASVNELAVGLLDEALKTLEFPGVVHRDGPSGRRAALARGPDVWEVIREVRRLPDQGDAKVRAAADNLGLHDSDVRLALSYYTAHPDEVDRRIEANRRALETARERAEAHERLLG